MSRTGFALLTPFSLRFAGAIPLTMSSEEILTNRGTSREQARIWENQKNPNITADTVALPEGVAIKQATICSGSSA